MKFLSLLILTSFTFSLGSHHSLANLSCGSLFNSFASRIGESYDSHLAAELALSPGRVKALELRLLPDILEIAQRGEKRINENSKMGVLLVLASGVITAMALSPEYFSERIAQSGEWMRSIPVLSLGVIIAITLSEVLRKGEASEVLENVDKNHLDRIETLRKSQGKFLASLPKEVISEMEAIRKKDSVIDELYGHSEVMRDSEAFSHWVATPSGKKFIREISQDPKSVRWLEGYVEILNRLEVEIFEIASFGRIREVDLIVGSEQNFMEDVGEFINVEKIWDKVAKQYQLYGI